MTDLNFTGANTYRGLTPKQRQLEQSISNHIQGNYNSFQLIQAEGFNASSLNSLFPAMKQIDKSLPYKSENVPSDKVNSTPKIVRNQSKSKTERKKTDVKLKINVLQNTLKMFSFAHKLLKFSSPGRFRSISQHQLFLIDDLASNNQKNEKISLVSSHEDSNYDYIYRIFSFKLIQYFFINVHCKKIRDIILKVPVISPTSSFRFIWDVVMMAVIMIFLFMIPIEVTFYKPLQELFPLKLIQICSSALIMDFFFSWNFGFFHQGIPIMNRKEVTLKYIKTSIMIDIIASLLLVIDSMRQNDKSNLLHLLFFLKIKSAKQFFKRIEERFNLNPLIMQITSLVQLLLLIVIASHVIACIWIEVSHIESQQGVSSWISDQQIPKSDWISVYTTAYYYSTVTMITVGYGDFKPINNLEMVISIMTMLTSCGIFAYTINQIGNIFNSINTERSQIESCLYSIGSYMKKRNIGLELQIQVKEYLQYQQKQLLMGNSEKEIQLVNQLSPSLKERLLHESYKIILEDYGVFKDNFSQIFISNLKEIIEEIVFRPDEIISSQICPAEPALYFVEQGHLYLSLEEGKKQIKILKPGQSYGELSFFSGQQDGLNLKSMQHSSVYRIKRQSFLELIHKFPVDYQVFCNIQDQLLYDGNHQDAKAECIICFGQHFPLNCQYVFAGFNKVSSQYLFQFNLILFFQIKISNLFNISTKQERSKKSEIVAYSLRNKQSPLKNMTNLQNSISSFLQTQPKEIGQYRSQYLYHYDETDADEFNTEGDDQIFHFSNDENLKDNKLKPMNSELSFLSQDYAKSQNLNDSFVEKPHQNQKIKKDSKGKNGLETITDLDEKEIPHSTHSKDTNLYPQQNVSLIDSYQSIFHQDFNQSANISCISFNKQIHQPSQFCQYQGGASTQIYQAQESQQNVNSPIIDKSPINNERMALSKKRGLISLQKLQTNFNFRELEFDRAFEKALNSNMQKSKKPHIQRKSLMRNSILIESPLCFQCAKGSESFQSQAAQSKNKALIIQEANYSPSRIRGNKSAGEFDENFEFQKNFQIYLPHNNLSSILEYLKFKQKKLRLLKSKKQGCLTVLLLRKDEQNLNFKLLRSFNRRKKKIVVVKKEEKINKEQVKISCAQTYMQLLQEKYQKQNDENSEGSSRLIDRIDRIERKEDMGNQDNNLNPNHQIIKKKTKSDFTEPTQLKSVKQQYSHFHNAKQEQNDTSKLRKDEDKNQNTPQSQNKNKSSLIKLKSNIENLFSSPKGNSLEESIYFHQQQQLKFPEPIIEKEETEKSKQVNSNPLVPKNYFSEEIDTNFSNSNRGGQELISNNSCQNQ